MPSIKEKDRRTLLERVGYLILYALSAATLWVPAVLLWAPMVAVYNGIQTLVQFVYRAIRSSTVCCSPMYREAIEILLVEESVWCPSCLQLCTMEVYDYNLENQRGAIDLLGGWCLWWNEDDQHGHGRTERRIHCMSCGHDASLTDYKSKVSCNTGSSTKKNKNTTTNN